MTQSLNLNQKEVKAAIKKARRVEIFVAFIEEHAQITKAEASYLADQYDNRTWTVTISDRGILYLEG